MRSLLFVPADDPRKIEKGLGSDADALIFDLEDSVAPDRKAAAREILIDQLGAHNLARPQQHLVRVNPLDHPDNMLDIACAVACQVAAIVLPKAEGIDDFWVLASRLAVAEAKQGRPDGSTGVLPIATETPAAVFQLGSYKSAAGRLIGLTWGAEDLAATIGASANRLTRGGWRPPFELARNLCLFGAHAAAVPAIDTVYTDFRDHDGLRIEAENARIDGFWGKLAIHPDQVPVINAAFTPTADEIEHAKAVIAALADAPTGGVAALHGRMIDAPHVKAARAVLARAAAADAG